MLHPTMGEDFLP